MAEYSSEQRNQLSRAIANNGAGSRQLKGFVDNRNSALTNKIFVNFTSTDNIPAQMYTLEKVSYNLGTEAKHAIEHRKSGYNFGSNIGYFEGGGTKYFGSAQKGHSEEQMLNVLGTNISPGDTLEEKQDEAVGDSFDANMYTELQPCNGNYGPNFNCDLLLNLALETDSKVYYSFDSGTTISQVQRLF